MSEYKLIDPEGVEKRITRRQTLFDILLCVGAGAAATYGLKEGFDYAEEQLLAFAGQVDREIARAKLDLIALSGAVERRLAEQTDKLEEQYSQGKLRIFEELDLMSPADAKKLEELIKNSRDFEQHYNVAERLRIAKDRIDQRILNLDETAEAMMPRAVRDFNDDLRKLLGVASGEEGRRQRKNVRDRLNELCSLYDVNENNRIAQTAVLEKLNEYANNSAELDAEEREVFRFLADQYKREGGAGDVRKFIMNRESFNPRNEAYLRLRAHVSECERLYTEIKENSKYLGDLQTLLKDGIRQVNDVRVSSASEFAQHRADIQSKVDELRESVDAIVGELKGKGYNIETREDVMTEAERNGVYGKAVVAFFDLPEVGWAPWLAGCVLAAKVWWDRRKSAVLRASKSTNKALKTHYNELGQAYTDERERNDALATAFRREKERDLRLEEEASFKDTDGNNEKYKSPENRNTVEEEHY